MVLLYIINSYAPEGIDVYKNIEEMMINIQTVKYSKAFTGLESTDGAFQF
jgi:hypothetical protein